ncbi:SirA family protein [Paenibacillus algicola]|uniref:SirA family protein n=1 Tax=Paenibacillus algicola TaxID=2565926 RepID=A0A4P8XFY1_9BACL|nr:sulfurtransferase TusA family protein [Paenibacillus algicola]QCT01195.1 SirA family protein [Paenibacillus algicola]
MNMSIDMTLDAKGLACPLPIVRTKKAMKELKEGRVLEVQATDPGSTADMKAWAEGMEHQYLGTVEAEGVLKHYLRKASGEEGQERQFAEVCGLAELEQKLDSADPFILLDVREPAEYVFGHIPGAVSVPLGELESRSSELDQGKPVYVICRSGTRSDLAAVLLKGAGFQQVINVVPGMKEWSGDIRSQL